MFPVRDAVDTRVIAEASGKLAPVGSGVYGAKKGIIDSQKNIGGWPELKSSTGLHGELRMCGVRLK